MAPGLRLPGDSSGGTRPAERAQSEFVVLPLPAPPKAPSPVADMPAEAIRAELKRGSLGVTVI